MFKVVLVRFLPIMDVDFDSSYYQESDAWVVLPRVHTEIGAVSAEEAARILNDVNLSPAFGYRAEAPTAKVLITIERYREAIRGVGRLHR